jgi:hypothetical protein
MHKAAVVSTSLLVLVFSYTAMSKLLDAASFRIVLEQVPLLKTGAAVLSVLLPLTELFIVLLLLFHSTRLIGLYAALALLVLFTAYLVYMLLYVPHLPCSCGGVIGAMSWKGHVVFSCFLIGVTVMGIRSFYHSSFGIARGPSLRSG